MYFNRLGIVASGQEAGQRRKRRHKYITDHAVDVLERDVAGKAHRRGFAKIHHFKGERWVNQCVVLNAQLQCTAQVGTAENGIAQHTELVNIDGCAEVQADTVVRVVTDQVLSQK